MTLAPEQIEAVESALAGPQGEALMALMQGLTTGRNPSDFEEGPRAKARELGWIDKRDVVTKLGWKMGDPMREFVQWNRRGRKVHDWERLPVFHREYFEGKRLLSIGCGCGTNLFSFQEMCSSVVGLELEPTYLQFTPIWARLAGVPVPQTVNGGSERMPFSSNEFDVVVCLGALQYMNITRALKEASRVLKPGGLAIFTLSDLRGYVTELRSRVFTFRAPQQFVREAAIFANMLAYPWTGRVVVRSFDPVYPTVRRIRRWFADVGLELDERLTVPFDHEYCYVARKR